MHSPSWLAPGAARIRLNVTGNGSAALTITNAGLSTFTKINIVDTGSGDRVGFNDSGANAYITDFAVRLTHSSAGIYFSGSSTFSGTASLSASTDCEISLNGANLSTANGDMDLTAAGTVTGDYASIDVIRLANHHQRHREHQPHRNRIPRGSTRTPGLRFPLMPPSPPPWRRRTPGP